MTGLKQPPIRGREFVETRVKERAGNHRPSGDPIQQRSRQLAGGDPSALPQFALHRVHPIQECFRIVEPAKLRRLAPRFPGMH